ncbi:MAG: NUDIX hydrolase [Planctomycetota bacterium]|nr:NUDIX hydrolase [Planctomycetota bacterium]
MAKAVIPTSFSVLVVVRKDGQYLLVRERKRGHGWYLPGGRVEPGENLIEAAIRETLEETGVPVTLDGLLRIEHTPVKNGSRVRLFFLGRPEFDTTPKRVPDRESLGARWFLPDELASLTLHHEEADEFVRYVESGAPAYPLELLAFEGAPLPVLRGPWA